MIPSNNISTTLVGNELGEASRNIRELCTSSKINMWCKYKPIRYDNTTGLVDYMWTSVDYGIIPPEKTTSIDDTKYTNWQYARPRGGAYSEQYRLGDFRKYDHSCAEPISPIGNFIYRASSGKINMPFTYKGALSIYNITTSDLKIINDYYPCVQLIFPDGSKYHKTSEYTFRESVGNIKISGDELLIKTDSSVYNYYMCAASAKKLSFFDSIPYSTYYPLPTSDASKMQGTITMSDSSGIEFVLKGYSTDPKMTDFYFDASKFYGPISPGDPIFLTHMLFSSGTMPMKLKYSVTNTLDVPFTITKSNLVIQVVPNLYSDEGISDARLPNMYNSSKISVDSIMLLSKETQDIIFEFTGIYAMKPNGDITIPPSNRVISSNIRFITNGGVLKRQSLRVYNQ